VELEDDVGGPPPAKVNVMEKTDAVIRVQQALQELGFGAAGAPPEQARPREREPGGKSRQDDAEGGKARGSDSKGRGKDGNDRGKDGNDRGKDRNDRGKDRNDRGKDRTGGGNAGKSRGNAGKGGSQGGRGQLDSPAQPQQFTNPCGAPVGSGASYSSSLPAGHSRQQGGVAPDPCYQQSGGGSWSQRAPWESQGQQAWQGGGAHAAALKLLNRHGQSLDGEAQGSSGGWRSQSGQGLGSSQRRTWYGQDAGWGSQNAWQGGSYAGSSSQDFWRGGGHWQSYPNNG